MTTMMLRAFFCKRKVRPLMGWGKKVARGAGKVARVTLVNPAKRRILNMEAAKKIRGVKQRLERGFCAGCGKKRIVVKGEHFCSPKCANTLAEQFISAHEINNTNYCPGCGCNMLTTQPWDHCGGKYSRF